MKKKQYMSPQMEAIAINAFLMKKTGPASLFPLGNYYMPPLGEPID